jgi:hypothetical protein
MILSNSHFANFHAAEQCHERRFDFVWCVGAEVFRDLTATFNQLAPWTTVRFIVDGIEDRSRVGEKSAKPGDLLSAGLHSSFFIRVRKIKILPASVVRRDKCARFRATARSPIRAKAHYLNEIEHYLYAATLQCTSPPLPTGERSCES